MYEIAGAALGGALLGGLIATLWIRARVAASAAEQGDDDDGKVGHCPWCVAQSLPVLPTQAAHAMFALHAERQAPPPALSAAVTAATLLAPSPRAPPALA